jgi:hypothetical protein
MKTLENKQTSVRFSNVDDEKMDYKALCRVCLNNNQRGPIYPEDMAERVRVLQALRECENGEILLEDADADTLQRCVKAFGFPSVDDKFELFQFYEDVKNMKKAPSKPKESLKKSSKESPSDVQ